ncbi:GNAT family N-acetyltransferase [Streptomyces griseoviridis]|jgi:ribosomal-protein-alanine N-acetyltransferase|uniref:Ribosomal-protein-alanine N-acetyltransferase n=3 Tax=Streptomyces TaxID=1883 RepID=A0ABT9LFY9_STRGD|nr:MULTISPECIES: GNAT family N-acetyltransferase [Streptomyces]MDP9681682.1 ribosomal-protein-alanine N-acetyltransferase [Streptomyces griseoviridis]GGS19147.1 N-acetyltransferase [Streptomyces niveoruber]GGS72833.1 N-acetyltransferase [Streptomyces griseoviridis]GGU34334.1 N-acetyltransferase [Streptomyces daghestanicus]GHI34321.1 N-acetyltransferase [Streptomyces daghestanicus]
MTAEPLERFLNSPEQLRTPFPLPAPPASPGTGDLVLRTARETDLPELRRLDQEVFHEVAYPGFLLRQLYDMYAGHFLVLDDGRGRLRGYVLAGTTALDRDSWILGLCVTRDRRRHGLGRELMTEILGLLRRAGTERVRLTVEPANHAAILLYRSLGFRFEEPEGGLRRDYFGPGMHRHIMRLELAGGA